MPAFEHLRRGVLFATGAPAIHVNQPTHVGMVPLHDHDWLELAVVAGGKAVHRTIHGTTAITPGDVLILRPGQWHAFEGCLGLRLANLHLGVDLVHGPLSWMAGDPILGPVLGFTPVTIPALRLDATSLAEELALLKRIREVQSQGSVRGAELIGLAIQALGVLGHSEQRGGRRRRSTVFAANAIVGEVVRLMRADLARAWILDDLAQQVGLDRSYLVRLFRRHTGLSPMAWLARERGDRAAALLLTTDQSITGIGAAVGWSDPNYFARRFRALFKQTPSAYRGQLPVPPKPMEPVASAGEWVQW